MRRYNRFASLTARWIKLSVFILFAGMIALGYGGLCADYGLTSKSTSGSSGVPIAPTGLSATTVSASQVDLSWTDNSRVEKGFNIERKTGTGSYQYLATVPSDTAYYSDTGLTDGTVYYYRIYAYNDTNKVVYSGEASATTVFNAPSALNILPVSSFRLDLGWTDNSNSEDGYKIERKSNENPAYAQITIVPTPAISGGISTDNTVTYSDTTVIDGMTYYYQVRAYNATGDSNYSNEASLSIAVNAPTGLIASTVSSTQTNLAWTDNSSNEAGFKIERKDSGAYAQIDTTGADITSYANTGLTTETTYYYQVRAYNAGLGDSTYSNEVPVTTLNPPTAITTTVISSSQIDLEWDDNSNLETGFKIERKAGAGGSYAQVLLIGANITTTSNTGVTDGTAYYYRVRASNASGNSSYSPESTVITTPLNAPASLTATVVSPTQINLGWVDTSGAEELFKIERDGVLTNTVPANTVVYNDSGLTAEATYSYRMMAYNSVWGNSNYSAPITVTTINTPSSLSATAISPTQVNLTWLDNSPVATGYRIERKQGTAGVWSQIVDLADGNSVSYSNTSGLLEYTTYYYRVCAYNTNNNSAYSDEVSTITLLGAPSSLSATAVSSSTVNLTWVDNTNYETYFRLERKDTGAYGMIAILSANSQSYADTYGLNEGTVYYYRVLAYNATVQSPWSTEASDTTLPGAPVSLAVSVISTTYITINWADKSSTEDGFRVERNGGELGTTLAGITVYTDTDVAAETPYSYRVRAYKGTANSLYSNEVSAVILNAPTSLTATAIASSQATLTWTNISTNATSVKIERKTTGSYAEIATVITPTATYANTGLTGETTYYYRVRAYDGTSYSLYSNAESTITFPKTPTSLIANVISSTAVTLNWTDNSGVEDGYKIERKTTGTYSEIADIPTPDTISFTNYDLISGTTYSWRVRAYDSVLGNSDYSNEVSAVPQSSPLQEAVDNFNLTFSTGGSANWFKETGTAGAYDNDAARSGGILDSQSTYLQTTVTGPGTLSYYWQVSSLSGDYLSFYVDGGQVAQIYGTGGGWVQKIYPIPAGSHTVKWEYAKDSSSTTGSDCGWVDKVEFTPVADITIAEAVDNITPTWTSGGSANWFGQALTSYSGGDAARSGYINHSQSSYFETTFTGPGTLTFWWKVSSSSSDYLYFYIDGVSQNSISGSSAWAQKTYNIASGSHTVRWTYTKNSSGVSYDDCGWVDLIEYAPLQIVALDEAVDNTSLTWSTGGNANWFGQTGTSYFGGDAAQSGDIADSQSTYLQTTVTGPGNLSFWWKVSSESSFDYLKFYIDSVEQSGKISGSTSWAQKTYSITAGSHTVKWEYDKDGSVSTGSDCGWVDKVEFTPTSLSLGEAVDNTSLTWNTSGDAVWFGQTTTSYSGGDAAQSGAIADSQFSEMTTDVSGGSVTFWWKVSSASTDYLEFWIGNTEQTFISGEVGWQQAGPFSISGAKTLKWKYVKDGAGGSGSDCGWVDMIQYSP
ncbi:MAG: fibronectin type III domain-containing protein [Planctomycetes bacterium]|nr:fibronectin type III domain-containing protein [Planctomycetota bacterium]